jgi:hypothetical protein
MKTKTYLIITLVLLAFALRTTGVADGAGSISSDVNSITSIKCFDVKIESDVPELSDNVVFIWVPAAQPSIMGGSNLTVPFSRGGLTMSCLQNGEGFLLVAFSASTNYKVENEKAYANFQISTTAKLEYGKKTTLFSRNGKTIAATVTQK